MGSAVISTSACLIWTKYQYKDVKIQYKVLDVLRRLVEKTKNVCSSKCNDNHFTCLLSDTILSVTMHRYLHSQTILIRSSLTHSLTELTHSLTHSSYSH